ALLPILQSNDNGPSRGKMLTGFYIDENILNSVSESTVVDFSLYSYKSPDVFTGLMTEGATQKTAGYPLTLISDDENSISSVTVIPDIYGNPALFARVDEPRDIFREGAHSLHLFFILTCIITILSGLILYSIILRMYVTRIEDMEKHIEEIGDRRNFSGRLKPQGHDELTTFTSSVNSMLGSLEEQHEEIISTKKRLMLALSGAKVIIWDLNITDMTVKVIRPDEEGGIWYPFDTDIVHINDMLQYTHPDDTALVTRTFMDHIAGKTDNIHTDFRIGKPGNWAWVTLLAKVSSTDNDGKPTRITGIMMNISEKEEYHQALIIANKKLNILSDVTRHDVLNQITALHGYSELMEGDYEENPEIMRYIKNLKRLINTIEQQIAFTKNYQEMGIRKPDWQNLHNVIISSSLNQLGGIIKPDVNVGDVEIFSDRMLEKVFFNLIGNSKQHGENVTEISITFHESDKNGIIVFSDNGTGIPAEKKEKIFEKGYGGSSGYGLFLAREILSITGIDIIETGEEGRGVKFEIIVPEGLYRFPGKTEKDA
ncbi:MAG: ATP-binding protein, partial [Euryarchaeota archaeon]|nr:ATP-binding protein [Euryarchaeota archaeon]